MMIYVYLSPVALVLLLLLVSIFFRVVVSPNEVHIVQSRGRRVAYGNANLQTNENIIKGKNVYYNWPSWLPILGNVVVKLPISIFDITLNSYESYDMDKVPFSVDIFAQFVVIKPNVASQKISNFEELKNQLHSVLQGVVRATLSTKGVEEIMVARKDLGESFLIEANAQIQEYGVTAVYLEFMNIEDVESEKVIFNIQEKRKSAIDKESRVEVAENKKLAEIAEIQAKKEAAVENEIAEQKVGEQQAEKNLNVGVANQKAQQEVNKEARMTADTQMEVKKVEQVRQAEIDKDVQVVLAEQSKETEVIRAEGEKNKTIKIAEGNLGAKEREAKGIEAVGKAEGEAMKAKELAPVKAKIELANAISELPEYMEYLLGLEGFKVSESVGVEKAKALMEADVKIISTGSNGDADAKLNGIMDVLSPKGGAQMGAMIDAFQSTVEGGKLKEAIDSFRSKKSENNNEKFNKNEPKSPPDVEVI